MNLRLFLMRPTARGLSLAVGLSLITAAAWGLGPAFESGLDDGYWDNHAVVYAEVVAWRPTEDDPNRGPLTLRLLSTLSGDLDAGLHPEIVVDSLIGGWAPTGNTFDLLPGVHLFAVLETSDGDFFIRGTSIDFMPFGACVIAVPPEAFHAGWNYVVTQLGRVRRGEAPLSKELLPIPPEFRTTAAERRGLLDGDGRLIDTPGDHGNGTRGAGGVVAPDESEE